MVSDAHIHQAGKLHPNEEKFLQKLVQILNPDWHIFCGLKFSRDMLAPNGEIDFILWHMRKGIVIFELKNDSRIQIFQLENGDFVAIRPGKNDKNLLDQVRRESRQLQHFLTRGNAPYPIVACLVLEETERPAEFAGTDFLFAGTKNPIFFEGEINENLNAILPRLLQNWRSRNQTAIYDFDLHYICGALGAFFDRALLLNDTAEEEKIHYAEWTKKQNETVEFLAGNSQSFCVTGGAGTGKTLIAQHFFRVETFKNRRRTLLLGWNKIHHWMQSYFIARNGVPANESRIETAEMLARKLLAGTDFAGTENFDELWNFAAKIARERPELLGNYETVIVDEAQLLNEKIWEIIQVFRENGARLIVFFDKNQRVIGGAKLPEWLEFLPLLTLTTACRCTPKIFNFVRKNILNDGCDLMPNLDENCQNVLVFDCGNDGEFRAEQMAQIGEIVRKNGLSAEQTIILGRSSKTDLAPTFAGRKIVFPQDKMIRHNRDGDFVQYFSISKFTGCEADYVVVYLPTDDDWQKANFSNHCTIYEACTRARSRLILALPSKAVASLIAKTDEQTFEIVEPPENRDAESEDFENDDDSAGTAGTPDSAGTPNDGLPF